MAHNLQRVYLSTVTHFAKRIFQTWERVVLLPRYKFEVYKVSQKNSEILDRQDCHFFHFCQVLLLVGWLVVWLGFLVIFCQIWDEWGWNNHQISFPKVLTSFLHLVYCWKLHLVTAKLAFRVAIIIISNTKLGHIKTQAISYVFWRKWPCRVYYCSTCIVIYPIVINKDQTHGIKLQNKEYVALFLLEFMLKTREISCYVIWPTHVMSSSIIYNS